MTLLIIGVLLWVLLHLLPTLGTGSRQLLLDRLGTKAYRGIFSAAIVGGLVLIVIGWRATPEHYLYVLPAWSRTAGFALMIVSFVLLGVTHYRSVIKRYVRHPMLLGVVAWAASHLLTNGTTRALILFGGLGFWALLEILLINRRDGGYVKPETPGPSAELKGLFISAIVFFVVLMLHPYFTGVTPIPR
jgi:uncharacterized membrane protein